LNGETVEQDRIFKVLGLSEEAIKRTFLIAQFGSLFLDLRSEEQSRLFTEVLNLDLWLKGSTVANDLANHADKELRTRETELSRLIGSQEQVKLQFDKETELSKNFAKKQKDQLSLLANQLEQEQAALDIAQKAISALSQHRNVVSAIAAAESETARVRASNAALAHDVQNANFELKQIQKEKDMIVQQLDLYNQSENICPECGQKVTQDHLNEKVTGLTKRLTKLSENILVKAYKRDNLTIKLVNLNEELFSIENSSKHKLKNLVKIQSEINVAETNVRLSGVKVENIKNSINLNKKTTNPHVKSCRDLTENYNQLKQKIIQIKQLIESTQQEIGIYKYWSQSYKEIRLALIDETLLELEVVTNKHAEALGLIDWNIKFATERQTVSGSTSHSFSVFIYPPDKQEPVSWESLSGGESTRWQLATTFGLAEVLLSRCGITPNIEVLDEPAKWISDSGFDSLLVHLRDRAVELGKCIYYIDHRSMDSGYFDGVISIEKSQNGSKIV
jgi:hypothetical protein